MHFIVLLTLQHTPTYHILTDSPKTRARIFSLLSLSVMWAFINCCLFEPLVKIESLE